MTYWSQVLDLDNLTERSRVEFNPSFEQILYLTKNNISFTVIADETGICVYCFNNKPDRSLTMKATVSDVILPAAEGVEF